MFNIDSVPEAVMLYDEGYIVVYRDGSRLKITEGLVSLTNKYGDVETMASQIYWNMPSDRPTYDELYEHWLKTK